MSGWKIWGISLLVFVGLVAGSFGLRWALAPVEGAVEKREQVYSAEHQMYSYEHFYDLCASVQRKQQSLDAQEDILAAAGNERRKGRIQTRIAALKSQIANDVAQYNADARKVETKAKFLGEDLPNEISADGEVTCR